MNQEILYMKTVVNDSDLINRALIIHSFPAELTKKIPDPNNTQEYQQYYLNKKKYTKTGETIKNM